MSVVLQPILDGDTDGVARFLHDHLDEAVSVASWRASLGVNDTPSAPNHGFMITDGGRVTGAYVAHYSVRDLGRGPESFCNLGAWCVLPTHRLHGVRLLRALLAQDCHHFLDLSPSGIVVALNERLGFRHLDTTAALVPTAPWTTSGVSDDPTVVESFLRDDELAVYRDHRDREAAHHVMLRRGGEHCWVVFRMDRRRNLPRVFASVLHVGNPGLFHSMLRPLAAHLLFRHGALAMLVELRLVGRRPAGSFRLGCARPKMYRSASLEPAEIDYFYSELVSVSW